METTAADNTEVMARRIRKRERELIRDGRHLKWTEYQVTEGRVVVARFDCLALAIEYSPAAIMSADCQAEFDRDRNEAAQMDRIIADQLSGPTLSRPRKFLRRIGLAS